jgi:hypothetical protein
MSDETGGDPRYGPYAGPPHPGHYEPHSEQPYPPQQPYQQQPYQPPPYQPAVGPARSGLPMVAALVSAAFVVVTAIVAYVANHPATSTEAQVGALGSGSALGSATHGGQAPVGSALPSATTSPAPASTATSTIPSRPQLVPEAINRTFEGYMNALVDHDLTALHSATCPKLRHTEVGFELHGKYVNSWRGKPYQISPDLDYVTVFALVRFRDPSTGASAGSATYSWYVEREPSGHYYVCGFLS